jgi:outer membrane protein TolC
MSAGIGRILCLVPVVVPWLMQGPLLAGEPAQGTAAPRGALQKPGLPAPYYYYQLGAATTEHQNLTVEDAIARALAQASSYQQSRLDELVAAEDEKQARVAYLPQLGVPLTYFGTTPSSARSAQGDPTLPSFVASNGIHHTIGFLSASGTLDTARRLGAARQRSRELLAAAHAGTAAAQRALVFATVDAYYGLSNARQKRRIADETLALAESFAELTRQLVEEGKAEEAERLRARAEALRRRDELEQARAGESSASDLLRALTGLPPSVHVGVARPGDELPAPGEFAGDALAAVERRPQLVQIDALQRAAQQDARAARAERHPQLSYTLNAGFEANETREFKSFLGGSAIVTLNIPVTNFGASRSREVQAQLREQSLGMLRENTLRQLRQEFLSARAATFSALDRIREADERANASQQNLTLLLARYAEGKATITELLDAQSASADARVAYSQAATDYQTSRVRLAVDAERLDFKPAASAALRGSEPTAACTVDEPGAPALLGLRLGMSLAEVRSRIRDLPAAPAGGVARLELAGAALGAPPSDDPGFAVEHVSLGLLDGRVYDVRVVFSGAVEWETKDAFVAAASERLGLPGPWKPYYDWTSKRLESEEDLRDLAVECRGFRIRAGLGFFSEGVKRVLSPHVKVESTAAADAARRRSAEPAQRPGP